MFADRSLCQNIECDQIKFSHNKINNMNVEQLDTDIKKGFLMAQIPEDFNLELKTQGNITG